MMYIFRIILTTAEEGNSLGILYTKKPRISHLSQKFIIWVNIIFTTEEYIFEYMHSSPACVYLYRRPVIIHYSPQQFIWQQLHICNEPVTLQYG